MTSGTNSQSLGSFGSSIWNASITFDTPPKIVVDGCEIDDESIRCDYMLLAKEIEFYIELKGQDLYHAVNQIKTTIKRLSEDVKKKNKKSYIICTRSPLSSTQIQNIKFDLFKNYNSDLQIKSSPYIERY